MSHHGGWELLNRLNAPTLSRLAIVTGTRLSGRCQRGVPLSILVVIALSVLALPGCGTSVEGPTPTSSASKPDLADLSDRMVITESGFPPVADGKYLFTPVRTLDADTSAQKDACDPQSWTSGGGQEAGSRVISEGTSARYNIEIFHTPTKVDMQAWAQDCLPQTEKDAVYDRIDLPGLPSGSISLEILSDNEPKMYLATGYARGVLVSAYVRRGSDGMPTGAKSDLVKIFNNQVELLDSY